METISLSGTLRTTSGKGSNRKMRSAGSIPAVLYGHGVESSTSVTLNPLELGKALENPKGSNALINLELEGSNSHTVLVREIQRDPVSRRILHVDLVAPNLEQPLLVTVDVNFSGKCPGVSMGGRLRTPYREVKLLARPADIPAEIAIDLGTLNIGDTIMASELELADGVSVVYESDFVVAKVLKPRGKSETEATQAEADS